MLKIPFKETDSTLLEHLDAFRTTLLWCLGAAVLFSVPGIIFAPKLLLCYVRYVCPEGMDLHYFTPLEPLIVELELGLLFGVLAALPFIFYKIAAFVAPGLHRHERRWGGFFIVSSLFLMSVGIAVALGAVVPIVMGFSGGFAADGLKPVIGLGAFLKLSALLSFGFALVFELPVALLLAIRFGVVSVETLRKKRAFIVVTLFVIAALMTPPDIVSQILMGVPGWILFELTLLIGERIAPKESEENEAAYPYLSLPAAEEEAAERTSAAAGTSSCSSSSSSPYVDDSIYRQAARKNRRIRHL